MKSIDECRVVIVAENPNVREEYSKYLTSLGFQFETAGSISELYTLLPQVLLNGLLLDVGTLVKASPREKASFHDLVQIFPSIRIQWDPNKKTVRVLTYSQTSENFDTLESFIKDVCVPFKARTLRFAERIDANFNVLLSPNREFSGKGVQKTVTVNISRGGGFLFTVDPPEPHQSVWIRILELTDEPLAIEVRWRKMWGGSMGMPGIGIRFIDISEQLASELVRIAGFAP